MTPNPVPSIPSRVPSRYDLQMAKSVGDMKLVQDYADILLAEVERMRKNWASSQWTYDEANSFLRSNDELRAEVERLINTPPVAALREIGIENDSLRATVAAQAAALNGLVADNDTLTIRCAQQAAELEKVRKDAERYRWLCDHCYYNQYPRGFAHALVKIFVRRDDKGNEYWMHPGHTDSVGVPTLDMSVDAALAQSANQMDAPRAKST